MIYVFLQANRRPWWLWLIEGAADVALGIAVVVILVGLMVWGALE